jgi:predicted ATPase
VFWGRAWEVEGAPACWPWIQALGACAPAATVDDADLAPLRSERHPPPGPDDPEAQSIRLGAAIVTLLRRLAAVQPLVLVFDDLHATDLASLTLLRHVARELRGMRVLVIGTYREIEARRSPTVSALLGRLARDGTAWPLGRLDRAAVERWVEESMAVAPAPALVSAVFAATEGNPLFVEAVAQLLVSRGYGAELPPGFVLPDTIRETLHELLARVSADTPRGARGGVGARP